MRRAKPQSSKFSSARSADSCWSLSMRTQGLAHEKSWEEGNLRVTPHTPSSCKLPEGRSVLDQLQAASSKDEKVCNSTCDLGCFLISPLYFLQPRYNFACEGNQKPSQKYEQLLDLFKMQKLKLVERAEKIHSSSGRNSHHRSYPILLLYIDAQSDIKYHKTVGCKVNYIDIKQQPKRKKRAKLLICKV
ncbi:hypothetical protein llap_1853 [Limosa lapponica baueri]|uniref:Uncharacterized protein n=1 Tax=Limosa lapponica baueri TaxID=1758121 RepID=A0A2I0UPB1_LIMLA|nr:hypothetical protein llap_1853 [Limosa lapponica baueri]